MMVLPQHSTRKAHMMSKSAVQIYTVMCSQTLTRHYPSRYLYEPASWSKMLAIQKQNTYLIVSVLLHLIVGFSNVSASELAHSATLQ